MNTSSEDGAKQTMLEWRAQQTLLAFYRAIDERRFDDCAGFFTEDGTWNRLGELFCGRAAIRQALERRPNGVISNHQVTNILAIPTDQGDVALSSLTVFYTHNFGQDAPVAPAPFGRPVGMWRVTTVLVETPAGLRIASHDMLHLLRQES